MKKYLLAVGMAALALTGCSGDKGASAPAASGGKASSAGMAMEEIPPMRESVLGSGVIDHTRDVKEFELRRSLWGVDDLIDQYTKKGYDTADLKAERSRLIGELKALLK